MARSRTTTASASGCVVKSVIRSMAPSVQVVDITHNVPAHDVRAGALALVRAVQYLAPGVVLGALPLLPFLVYEVNPSVRLHDMVDLLAMSGGTTKFDFDTISSTIQIDTTLGAAGLGGHAASEITTQLGRWNNLSLLGPILAGAGLLVAVVRGEGQLVTGGAAEQLASGQTWLLPASAGEAWLEPRGGLGVVLSTLPPGLEDSPGALLQSPSGLGILEPFGRSE